MGACLQGSLCLSPGLISDKLCGKVGGGQPYLPGERQGATPRGKGATGLQRKCWPSDQEERYKEPCKKKHPPDMADS